MLIHGFPRVVAFGGGAGLVRVLTGLAAMRGGSHYRQHDVLTAVVPGASDVEEAEALVNHCARVLPATADAGPVRRAYPETLRRIINADLIVAAPCDIEIQLLPSLGIGGIAATLTAVTAPRVFVVGDAGDLAGTFRDGRWQTDFSRCFNHVVRDPGGADRLVLVRAILEFLQVDRSAGSGVPAPLVGDGGLPLERHL
jgi:2-phospho-L-lactate transferase/gluconeogenesis factor (CofD/UPF0052 family)